MARNIHKKTVEQITRTCVSTAKIHIGIKLKETKEEIATTCMNKFDEHETFNHGYQVLMTEIYILFENSIASSSTPGKLYLEIFYTNIYW